MKPLTKIGIKIGILLIVGILVWIFLGKELAALIDSLLGYSFFDSDEIKNARTQIKKNEEKKNAEIAEIKKPTGFMDRIRNRNKRRSGRL